MAFRIKQGDLRPSIKASLDQVDGATVSIPNLVGASVRFVMTSHAGTTRKVDAPAVIEDVAKGIVRYDWSGTDTDTVGTYDAEWHVTYADTSVQTFPLDDYMTVIVEKRL